MKILEQLKYLKKGMMQILLIQGINHEKLKKINWLYDKKLEIPITWDIQPLSKLANVVDSRHYTPKYVESGYPLILPRNVTENGLDLSNTKFTTKEDYENLIFGNRKPEYGDLIYTRNASFGMANQVKQDMQFSLGQDLVIIKPHKINSYLLQIILNSSLIIQQLNRLISGSTFKRINLDLIRNFSVIYPNDPLEESQIASFFANLDSQIQTEILYTSTLKRLQKGLMKQLFSRQINVKNQNMEI